MQGSLFLLVMALSGGASTALIRQAIVDGVTDEARFYRAFAQTVCILVGTVLLLGFDGLLIPPRPGVAFAALNGVLGGVAFILFSKGLETVEASTGKPALVVSMVVAATLGIVVLGESLTAEKFAGIALAGVAIYLLAGDGG